MTLTTMSTVLTFTSTVTITIEDDDGKMYATQVTYDSNIFHISL